MMANDSVLAEILGIMRDNKESRLHEQEECSHVPLREYGIMEL